MARGRKSEGLRPHDFASMNIVAIAVFIQPLGSLIGQVCVLLYKGSDMATGCRAVQTVYTEHAIFDGGNDGLIGLESNTALNAEDFAICVGMIGKLSSHIFFSLRFRGAPSLIIQVYHSLWEKSIWQYAQKIAFKIFKSCIFCTNPRAWPVGARLRIMGVSSYGGHPISRHIRKIRFPNSRVRYYQGTSARARRNAIMGYSKFIYLVFLFAFNFQKAFNSSCLRTQARANGSAQENRHYCQSSISSWYSV